MNHPENWQEFISPLKLTILAVNLVCFGACLVLLAVAQSHSSDFRP